ncbi:hypothetical protein [Tenggerimyces flavus]|uniref:Secreted protein n=1 Tax=Tenggerimyces flavus TaxID=1708749 RepID=A0ABV7YCZ8_9ACTN|nr:hypothetical protein [Tenggerimyces flavus]MBM7789773.1 hypothetical protein [Tenggerimyces flavus]
MTRHTNLAVLIAALAMATACTPPPSNEIATAASPTATTSATSRATADPHRFAACLRERGIDVADPRPGQQVELPDKDDRTREALRACAQFAPPSQQQESSFDPAAARAYAQCVRAQGLPDFPDPDERGPRIPKNLIDDERFRAADQECSHHLNDAKGGGKQ